MDYIAAIIIILLLLWRMVSGFKKGLVKEVAALLSLIVTGFCILLIMAAIGSFWDKNMGNTILMVVVLFVLCLVYRLIHTLFTSIQLISRLPIVNIVNKLLGAAAGVAEAVVILWIFLYVAGWFHWPVPEYLRQDIFQFPLSL